MTIRVLRVYHGGRISDHRGRERALATGGIEISLVVPATWPEGSAQRELPPEPFEIIELPVRRAGDVNRHVYLEPRALRRALDETHPDLIDIHEEPFSLAARQWLRASPPSLPAVLYTAQNIDKRFPPPFARYEARAYARAAGLYPVSRQAASVARGKGFDGLLEVLPLGFDESIYTPGRQSASDAEIVLGFAGRFAPEKGLCDAVEVLAALARTRTCRLLAVGGGPQEHAARALAASLGVADRMEILPWQAQPALAELYRSVHVLLVPSTATAAWAEQFGRVIVEAQASGAVVAAYASGAIPEVADGPALLAVEGDKAGLAAHVVAVLTDPDEYARRRELGIALAAGRTWTHVAQLQAAFYERVLAGTPPQPTGRTLARQEFGPTATTPLGRRPPALPGIRRVTPLISRMRRASSR